MSRIGVKPITVPAGVEVTIATSKKRKCWWRSNLLRLVINRTK